MTWYWWTHWFWITSTLGAITTILLATTTSTVQTYPLSPPFENSAHVNDKPIKFPTAASSDIDDVFSGSEDNLNAAATRDKEILQNKEQADSQNDDRISDNSFIDHRLGNESGSVIRLVPDKTVDSKGLNDTQLSIIRSKGDVEHMIVNNNNTNTSSFISTNSPVEATSNSSQPMAAVESGEEITNNTSHLSSSSHADFIDYDHNASNNSDSSEESSSQLNQTASASAVDFLDDVKPYHYKPHTWENITKEEEIIRAGIERQLSRKSKVLAEYRHEFKHINFSSDAKNLLARSAAVSLDFDEQDDGNISSEALSIQRAYILDAGAISGICFAVLGLCFGVALVGIVLYRRRYLNKPQTLSEPDSSGYIDDSTIRDNSDEMYSLDNDSFLNSLEAMTIQNYWTDTVKHTKL